MKINYEILFWAMLVFNCIALCYLISLVQAVNDLVMKFGILKKRYDNFDEDIRILTSAINSTVGETNERLSDVADVLEDIMTPEESNEDTEEQEIAVLIEEDPIHLITPNQYFFEKGHDKFEGVKYDPVSGDVYYYYDVFDDSKYIVIDNVAECIGEALKFFGINSKNERVVYVRNNIFKADFMIERLDG